MIGAKNRQLGVYILLIVALSSCAWGQQPTQKRGESTKYRKIGTFAGLGGGFVLGTFVGLNVFDQAINSEQKILITAFASAAAGALGGYFLGRAIDQRQSQVTWMYTPNELDRSLMRTRSLAHDWQTIPIGSPVGKWGFGPEASSLEQHRIKKNNDHPQLSEELKRLVPGNASTFSAAPPREMTEK